MAITITVNGQDALARRRAGHAAAVGDPRNARPDRHQVRLRHRRLRRLHRAPERPRRALVHAAGLGGRGRGRHDDRGAGRRTARSTRCSRPGSTHQVPQCGYCQSGMIMAVAGAARAAARIRPTTRSTPRITNICRCGTFARVRRAIHAVAEG